MSRLDLNGMRMSEVLDLLERGKLGYGAAMDYFDLSSRDDLHELMHLNRRRMPGHKPLPLTLEAQAALRSVYRRASSDGQS